MKRIIKEVIGCLVAFALIMGAIYRMGNIVRPVDTDVALNAIETFHEMPEHSIEVIGYGSSHIWRGMNPMEMYKNYGIAAYNYGCNWQHINTTELFLKDSLLTQSPKIAIIETYRVNDLLQNTNVNGEIYYTRGITEFEGKQEYLKQCFGDDKERYLSYYMPLCAFHDNWVNLTEENFMKSADETNFGASMGYLSKTEITPITIPDPATFEQESLSDAAVSVLDEIVRTCKENNIQIIFYTAPWEGTYAYSDAMKAYTQKNDSIYLNLFEYVDEMGINEETDFSDGGHLNNNGSVKVANFLGNYIVDNYEITDMRKVKGNIWEKNL